MRGKTAIVAKHMVLLIVCVAANFTHVNPAMWASVSSAQAGEKTITQVMSQYGSQARSRIIPYFEKTRITYPPQNITLLAIKDSATLEVWAGPASRPTFIRSYDIKTLSGISGPKLREGDRQVPEGIYKIEALNPNSNFHLSIKLNYPNEFDLKHASEDNRLNPGSNIFIHGNTRSIGCLAMGDRTIEELFVLTVDVEKENISVIIAPTDPRKKKLAVSGSPEWVADLYISVSKEFANYIRY